MKYKVTIEVIDDGDDVINGITMRQADSLHLAISYALQDSVMINRGEYYLPGLILSLIDGEFIDAQDWNDEWDDFHTITQKIFTRVCERLKKTYPGSVPEATESSAVASPGGRG